MSGEMRRNKRVGLHLCFTDSYITDMHIYFLYWFFKPSMQRSTWTPFCYAVAGPSLCERKTVNFSNLLPKEYTFSILNISICEKRPEGTGLEVTPDMTRKQLCTGSLLLDSSMIKKLFFEMFIGVGIPSLWTHFVVFGETSREKITYHCHCHVTGKVRLNASLSVKPYGMCVLGRKRCKC